MPNGKVFFNNQEIPISKINDPVSVDFVKIQEAIMERILSGMGVPFWITVNDPTPQHSSSDHYRNTWDNPFWQWANPPPKQESMLPELDAVAKLRKALEQAPLRKTEIIDVEIL